MENRAEEDGCAVLWDDEARMSSVGLRPYASGAAKQRAARRR